MSYFALKTEILILESSLILWIKTDDTFHILQMEKLRYKVLTDIPNTHNEGWNLDFSLSWPLVHIPLVLLVSWSGFLCKMPFKGYHL